MECSNIIPVDKLVWNPAKILCREKIDFEAGFSKVRAGGTTKVEFEVLLEGRFHRSGIVVVGVGEFPSSEHLT